MPPWSQAHQVLRRVAAALGRLTGRRVPVPVAAAVVEELIDEVRAAARAGNLGELRRLRREIETICEVAAIVAL